MSQQRAFGSAGGSARIKRPRAVRWRAVDRTHQRVAAHKSRVIRTAGGDDCGQCLDRLLERRERLRKTRRRDEHSGTAIPRNVLDLPGMKAGIDRDCTEARRPASEQAFEELGAILHAQQNTVPFLQAAAAETPRQARNATGEFAVAPGVNTV